MPVSSLMTMETCGSNSMILLRDKTLRHIVLYDLWDKYDSRIKQCLRWASPCGWGFPDALNDMYEEMKAQNEELRKKYRNFKMPINADY